MTRDIEDIASQIIQTAMGVHVDVEPGLLESVYETLLATRLQRQGLHVDRQIPVKAKIDDIDFPDAFRADILVEGQVLVELGRELS